MMEKEKEEARKKGKKRIWEPEKGKTNHERSYSEG
jgi:hypothetical protein